MSQERLFALVGNRPEVLSGRNLLFPAGIAVLHAAAARLHAGGGVGEPGEESENDSGAVGFIVAEAGRAGHIITIDVLDEFRRSGLGSQLMAAAEDRLRSEGLPVRDS